MMLNPFALFLYLNPVMDQLEGKLFVKVLFKASLISFLIYVLFLFLGDILFTYVFRIHFESFRIFGGIVIFSYAYYYLVQGRKAIITLKEDLNDLASEIALPFMVGAGTISLTILMRHDYSFLISVLLLTSIMTISFFIILLLKMLKGLFTKRGLSVAFNKNIGIVLRLNSFFIGAIGIDMIIKGITNLLANK